MARTRFLSLGLLWPMFGCVAPGASSEVLAATDNTTTFESERGGSIVFEGEVEMGRLFARGFGDGFAFLLRPMNHGWSIDVRDERGTVDVSMWSPPWRGPRPTIIHGWHFRNADNTGPNGLGSKSLNVPGKERNFMFTREVGRTIPAEGRYPTREEMDSLARDGQGTLRILEYELEGLEPGQKARFKWMRFRVELEWRSAPVGRVR